VAVLYKEYDETVTRLAALKVVLDIADKTALNLFQRDCEDLASRSSKTSAGRSLSIAARQRQASSLPPAAEQWCGVFLSYCLGPGTSRHLCVQPAFPVQEHEPPGVAAENFLRQALQLKPSHALARELRSLFSECRGFFVAPLQWRSK
jgi:hypothetical protein